MAHIAFLWMPNVDFLFFQVRAAIVGNYKHERLYGRGEEYGDAIINSAFEEAKKTGLLRISRYESQSGQQVDFRVDGKTLMREE